ncbi:hypothetical protein [Bremerella alba]|nr:hypothetical protein [Bremerella alba]
MSYGMVDIEADGPISGDYSMMCFAALLVEIGGFFCSFYGKPTPISEKWILDALACLFFARR